MSTETKTDGKFVRENQSMDFSIDFKDPVKLKEGLFKATSQMYFPHHGVNLKLEADGSVPSSFEVTTIQGGITNMLYKCTVGEHSILVRIYGAKTEEVIDRERENTVVNELSRRKFGPGIWGRVQNGRLEEFLPGKCLSPDQMTLDEVMSKVARRLTTLHAMKDMPIKNKGAGLWATLDMWMSKALTIRFDDNKEKAKLLAELNLPKLKEELAELRAKIEKGAITSKSPLVFAHNDLLSGNIMWDKEAGTIELVDYEYGSFNPRGFDIANHFCECCGFDCLWDQFPTKEKQAVFFRNYLSAASGRDEKEIKQDELDNLYLEVQPYVLAAHFFWGTWAVLQARYSPIEFDYMGYSKLRFGGYAQMKDACLKLL